MNLSHRIGPPQTVELGFTSQLIQRFSPHCPQQNGLVERVIRTLEKQCVHRLYFVALQPANRVITDWIGFYNQRRPHQALGMKTPAP